MKKKESNALPSVAVIGTGYWGKNLVRNFHQIGALKMICDKNEAILGALQAHHTDVEICYALTDVLKRNDIDGVVIATPAETHFLIAREALLAAKHILVEKPLVLDEWIKCGPPE
jgi:UDP-2-acetamido-3-amino-2,3-dideoxy-glucuronate N-acetyltransferase